MYSTKNLWNFPSARGIQRESINDPGIETFKDHPLNSLAREICQNSLDAREDFNKPVTVTFDRFSIESKDFPGIEKFRENHEYAEQTWRDNSQALEYIEKAKKVLNAPRINFLKISDYNTKGLLGADTDKLGSPWSTLVKEVGSSNKSDTSGGSFGIGKFAPFANSDIRTVFYATCIPNGKFYIGVSKFMSFDTVNGETTTGVGYYSSSINSDPIRGHTPFYDEHRGDEHGTDVFVAGFNKDDTWITEVIKSVINNFFITIWKGKLMVIVDGKEINQNNLHKFIEKYGEKDTKGYYDVLTNEQTIKLDVVNYSKEMGEPYGEEFGYQEQDAQLYLLKTETGNRRILMTRSTGMWLFEQKNISASIFFTGILMIEGDKMNSDFKKMENPSHTEWSPERYIEDPKKAKRMYENLRKFNRNAVISQFQEDTGEEMDAMGMSDFLPDNFGGNPSGLRPTEVFETDFSRSNIKKIELPKNKMSKDIQSDSGDVLTQVLDEIVGTPDDGDTGGGANGNTGDNSHVRNHPGSGSGNLGVDGSEGNDIFTIYRQSKGKPVEVFHKVAVTKKPNEYQIIMKSSTNLKDVIIEIFTIGEVSKSKAILYSAELNGVELKIRNNMIHIPFLKSKEVTHLKCSISFDGLARIGVNFNEAKK
ncbi:hypothetical protein [Phocicoccus pinnipedialis]|uniref:Uncharacterized protein n=1 Tax=Phocicoccus pinnipedialis TaxID=110845 RepID=A0A6V7R4E0_9BACL|nr:hypothetical protein [Jeotgalicoccus pinnipedialis]MBP1939665.1 hypothetical protein [Jeotgalicoccus pinnipedialis]CAD2072287.1 hypothetical protein JEOPIN946_00385 [Jeotgalicoccus pinnipedialis]